MRCLKTQTRLLRFLTVSAVLLSVTCNPSHASDPVYGGDIKVAINSDIRSTNPGVKRDGNTDTVLYHVAEGLVAFNESLQPAPMLAETVTESEDGKRYDFTLRKGVKFHNGSEMTSADVLWSWERLLAPETGFRCLSDFNGNAPNGLKIEKIVANGPYSVSFYLNKASSLFLNRMSSFQCLAAILHPDSVDENGAWVAPIGTGPYTLEKWVRGQYVSLSRFSDYSSRTDPESGLTGEKKSYFDRIIFQIVPDRIAGKSSVYAGNIDLVYALPLSAAKEVERRAEHQKDVKVYHQNTFDWTNLLIQTQDPLLSDVRMRRALAHAISQDMLSTFTSFGYAPPNSSAVQSLSPYRALMPDVWPEYNPEKARALAAEAGYKGEVLTIQANRKYSYMFDNAVAIQAMLNAAGFNVKIDVFDWATQLTNFFKGDFQLSSFGYSARSHPALVYDNIIGHKDQRPSAQWDNPEAFTLLEKLESAKEGPEMLDVLTRLHVLMAEQVPVIGLYNDHVVDLSAADIEGYKPWPFGRPRLWGVWRSKEGEAQK
ncbi:ABC transporter substrate-binding protein [Kordiimonas pumila]|uniref:ABC transporter substrate-binding protein n=1 Tax=Kordiimonas pumila TaxID=2161677 RepID=A0ABV7D7R6_9PROT|nr:ABC transporter substrate-binding protein [Kordiimonas pumila]